MRVLTCLGDATAIQAHGGLPYHLLEAGKRAGFIDCGWPLAPEQLRRARAWWNLRRLFTHGQYGGFQYSRNFIRALLEQVPTALANPAELITIFPLLAPDASAQTLVTVYIDATFRENFNDYGIDKKVGHAIIDETLEIESQVYRDAIRILCRSRSAARSLVDCYGIDAKKIHIVPGGANIACNPGSSLRPSGSSPLSPVRLGFVGKDWRRKNLPFIIRVAELLKARGVEIEVVAAGFDPARGPRHPLLKAIGFLDKRTQMPMFIDLLRSCHFTCLFSHAEAFGLCNRESLRLGVPVLASSVGGIPDTVPDGCGHLFPVAAEAADVADLIEGYVRDPERYWSLRDAVGARAEEFSWSAAVVKMQAIWSGSREFAYAADGLAA